MLYKIYNTVSSNIKYISVIYNLQNMLIQLHDAQSSFLFFIFY